MSVLTCSLCPLLNRQVPNGNTFPFHFIINSLESTAGLGNKAQRVKYLLFKSEEQFGPSEPM